MEKRMVGGIMFDKEKVLTPFTADKVKVQGLW